VFPVIFIGELPDKTMFATVVMASRGHPRAVWLGVLRVMPVGTMHRVSAVLLSLLAVAAATLAFTGPGQFSLDRGWRWSRGGALPGLVSLALGIGGALIVLAVKAVG